MWPVDFCSRTWIDAVQLAMRLPRWDEARLRNPAPLLGRGSVAVGCRDGCCQGSGGELALGCVGNPWGKSWDSDGIVIGNHGSTGRFSGISGQEWAC